MAVLFSTHSSTEAKDRYHFSFCMAGSTPPISKVDLLVVLFKFKDRAVAPVIRSASAALVPVCADVLGV
jgi:hypothetical protein